jgi:hypothetical protein
MFYIHGKFGRNRMKFKEDEASLVLLHAFLTGAGVLQPSFTYSTWTSPMPVNIE